MLLTKPVLRQVLSWSDPAGAPDLAVVLVDLDGEPGRKQRLLEHVADLISRPVIGVAVQEIEAWLVADHVAAGRALDRTLDQPSAPEGMRPREAKQLWAAWAAALAPEARREARRRMARECDLDAVERACPKGFGTFRSELRGRAAQLAAG
jgi:hypothetical protein